VNPSTRQERLAVCSWSLQPSDPRDLIEKLRAVGILRLQLALDPLRESPKVWGDADKIFLDHGVSVVSGMVACVGEDYSTLESIRLTGGIAPDKTWEQNLENFRFEAALAAKLGLKLVTFHAGFLPPEEIHAPRSKMRERLAAVAGVFGAQRISVGLETGQETALELAELLRELNLPNVGVNFDPANMILYDKGDPVEGLRKLAAWIRQVHIKDAKRTRVPGVWGEEVPMGSGDVRWPEFFAALRDISFRGDLCFEREAGNQRVADIQTARGALENALR
jgi:sugar phosphate isomerase/epimerase